MSTLYQKGRKGRFGFDNLVIPESFDESLSYGEQILWLFIHKQATLIAGENVTLTNNHDGTFTISSEAGGSTYRIDSVTPSAGYDSAYALIDTETEQQCGVKIQIPAAIPGPEGPEGPQGPAGQDGADGTDGQDGVGITSITFKESDPIGNNVYTITLTNGSTYDITCPIGPRGNGILSIVYSGTDPQGGNVYTVNMTDGSFYTITAPKGDAGTSGQSGQDGVGISSITFKETDASGNNIYTITLTNSNTYDITCPIGPQGQTGQTGPAGQGVPTGGSAGEVLTKASGTDYDAQWLPPSGGNQIDNAVRMILNTYYTSFTTPISGLSIYTPNYSSLYELALIAALFHNETDYRIIGESAISIPINMSVNNSITISGTVDTKFVSMSNLTITNILGSINKTGNIVSLTRTGTIYDGGLNGSYTTPPTIRVNVGIRFDFIRTSSATPNSGNIDMYIRPFSSTTGGNSFTLPAGNYHLIV